MYLPIHSSLIILWHVKINHSQLKLVVQQNLEPKLIAEG
jgi:hypothetical protein